MSKRSSGALTSALPGCAGRSGLVVGGQVPPCAVRAEGCRVLDETGRWLIDAHNDFTVLIHGHGYPPVLDALTEVIGLGGTCYGLPNPYEATLAGVIADRITSVDLVRFANSGTEAVQTAVRLARATTGRSQVIGVAGAYHGSSEPALSIYGSDYVNGVPESVTPLIHRVPFGDIGALEKEIGLCGDDLALVLVDPMANYTGLRMLSEEFIGTARRLCDEVGALLAFDEVVSFRHHFGGMQALYPVDPDLTIMGKAIGGGLPIGAVGGRASAMELLDATRPGSLHSSGTFTGNPLSMAAGIACLAAYDEAAIVRLNGLGDHLRRRFADGLPAGWETRGYGSLVRPVLSNGTAVPSSFFWNAHERGLLVTAAPLVVLSTPMTVDVVDEIADILIDCAELTNRELDLT